jgi:hypothetical protein
MTDLIDLSEKLQDTNAAIATLEKALVATPTDSGLVMMLKSLEHRQRVLEHEFAAEADARGVDVFRYALDRGDGEFPLTALADSLRSFQSWLTAVFDAIRSNRPKTRARVSAENTMLSTLDFGYSFAGSVGFVFTMPRSRVLIGESELDQAVAKLFEMMRVGEPDQLAQFARDIGLASVKKMYDWAHIHSQYALGANIQWQRAAEIRGNITFQPEEASRLETMIENTSPETIDTVPMIGLLEGGDLQSRAFHLSFPEATDIKGYMTEDFEEPDGGMILGRRYRCELRKHTIVRYAEARERVWWELAGLTPLLSAAST